MKKLKLTLAVLLTFAITCALLIGCTPGKPVDYMTKWTETKNKSYTEVYYSDEAQVFDETTGEYKPAEFGGTTTAETTLIKNESKMMLKMVSITNLKDKNGKDSITDDIKPAYALIFELNKEGKYNLYEYKLEVVKDGDKFVEKGKWTATQETKENVESGNYDFGYYTYSALIDQLKDCDEEFAEMKEDFETKYPKEKGKYIHTFEDSSKQTIQIKSGEMIIDNIDKDEKLSSSERFVIGDKITIASGAKDALTAYLETTDGTFVKVESDVYYISVNGAEYKVNNKVAGYDILKDAKAGDVISVRLTKNFFGKYSIKEVYAIK